MFYGQFEHTIDRKGRLTVPAKFRQTLKQQDVKTLYLTLGLDGCLFLFPEPEWRVIEGRFKQISFMKSEGRKFHRLFFSNATEVTIDTLGRIAVSKTLKRMVDIEWDVVVVGVSTRMEIWAKKKWYADSDEMHAKYEELAERVIVE